MRDFRYTAAALGYPQSLLLPSVAAFGTSWLWSRAPSAGWLNGLVLMAAGLFAWTLLEYLLHRVMLHRVEPFASWHLQHHRQPEVPMRTPLAFSLMLILPLVGTPLLLHAWTGSLAAFFVGLVVGHLMQEIVHHRLHAATPPDGRWLAARWHDHDFHHHRDERMAYGTLTGFWDDVFRTRVRRVPAGSPTG